jgi:prepilin-type N-terminal cleavage/methylation domain-containing protein
MSKNSRAGFWRFSRAKRAGNRGLTMIEILIAVGILSLLVGLGFPAIRNSKKNAEMRGMEAEAKILNDAIRRVEMGDNREDWHSLSNIIYIQEDEDAAIQWLEDHGYVNQRDKRVEETD